VSHHWDPQKALPWAEQRVLSPHWSRSDALQCDLWPFLRNQKTIKRQWQTGYSPRPPTSPYRSQSLHAAWPPVCSSIFQVLLKSVQWFCRCGWSNIAFPHYFGHWLIQQLVLPYKPWFEPNLVQNTNATLPTRWSGQIHINWKSKMAVDWINISAPNFMGRRTKAEWDVKLYYTIPHQGHADMTTWPKVETGS